MLKFEVYVTPSGYDYTHVAVKVGAGCPFEAYEYGDVARGVNGRTPEPEIVEISAEKIHQGTKGSDGFDYGQFWAVIN